MILQTLPVQTSHVADSGWSIVPGVRIGGIRVGAEEQRAIRALGRPAAGDAAMGHRWNTWIGREGGRLDVYAASDGDRPKVSEIRATSPRFRLARGLRVGLASSRFRTVFPDARMEGHYVAAGKRVDLWDSKARGLAWESSSGSVAAIIVHRKGEALYGLTGGYQKAPLSKEG